MHKILIINIIFLYFFSYGIMAQTPFGDIQIKEAFEYSRKWYSTNYFSDPLNGLATPAPAGEAADPSRISKYEGYAEAIQSHITMYQITKDKAHLIKAINFGLGLMSRRYDYLVLSSGHKSWTDFDIESQRLEYWYEGFICAALAELAYIMLAEPVYSPELVNLPLPVQLIANPLPSYSPYIPVPLTTYGDIGAWFTHRVNETLTYLRNEYWADDAGWLYGNGGAFNCNFYLSHKGLQGLNMHSPLTVAVMYLKAIDPDATMGFIPDKIVDFYFSEVPIYNDDDDNTNCDPLDLLDYTSGCKEFVPMHLNENYNAYWWFYEGWSRVSNNDESGCFGATNTNCRKPCSELTSNIEDLGHADFTMEFPIHAMQFGNQYFSDDDMIRWRNTFAKLIWDPYNPQGPGFHTSIYGRFDNGVSNDLQSGCWDVADNGYFNCDETNAPNGIGFWGVPLRFMPLYKYDGADGTATEPNVYNIVMDYYRDKVESKVIANSNIQNNRSIYGISRVASAQWDKECPNLTLYNRDVVYNQDFFAKGDLIIAPNQDSDPFYTAKSFADPEITTQDFFVEPGVTANFKAGKRIVVKKGHIKSGARSRGYIDASLYDCGSGRLAADESKENNKNSNNDNETLAQSNINHDEIRNSDNTKSAGQRINGLNKSTGNAGAENETANTVSHHNSFSIVPNPSANGLFTISGAIGTITITNLLGEVVFQSANLLINSSANQKIDISTYPKGIYFVKLFLSARTGKSRTDVEGIQNGNEISVQKIVYQ